jgi:hypothetical protein
VEKRSSAIHGQRLEPEAVTRRKRQRSLAPCWRSLYIGQLWLFRVAPITGAMIAGFPVYKQEAMIRTTVIEERRVS